MQFVVLYRRWLIYRKTPKHKAVSNTWPTDVPVTPHVPALTDRATASGPFPLPLCLAGQSFTEQIRKKRPPGLFKMAAFLLVFFPFKGFLAWRTCQFNFFVFLFFYKWAEVNFSISLATGFWLATPSFLSPGIHVFKISRYSSKNGAWHFCELATWTPSKWKVKTNIFFPSSFPTKTVDWNP